MSNLHAEKKLGTYYVLRSLWEQGGKEYFMTGLPSFITVDAIIIICIVWLCAGTRAATILTSVSVQFLLWWMLVVTVGLFAASEWYRRDVLEGARREVPLNRTQRVLWHLGTGGTCLVGLVAVSVLFTSLYGQRLKDGQRLPLEDAYGAVQMLADTMQAQVYTVCAFLGLNHAGLALGILTNLSKDFLKILYFVLSRTFMMDVKC